MEEIIAEEDIEVYIENGIMHGVYREEVVIDINVIKEGIEKRLALSQGKPYPILADGRGIKYWTLEARKYGSSTEANKDASAYAFLISSPIIKTIANWTIKFHPTKGAPQRIFTDRDKALQWLEQFKR